VTYSVKETYLTIQGEGAYTGRVAVFCRFAGCNLWSGLEEDRSTAVCQFCDTEFVGIDGSGGGKFDSSENLTNHILSFWNGTDAPFVVFTGGEPLLQMDDKLVEALKKEHVEMAIETNGTLIPPDGIDWICVSPKQEAELLVTKGDELKIIYPQDGLDPSNFLDLDFDVFSLQPMDGPEYNNNLQETLAYCRTHSEWRLSLQTHKYLQIP
jgi:7-carboxy-7-deazaguanine synthase (Cx14CxxC type)